MIQQFEFVAKAQFLYEKTEHYYEGENLWEVNFKLPHIGLLSVGQESKYLRDVVTIVKKEIEQIL